MKGFPVHPVNNSSNDLLNDSTVADAFFPMKQFRFFDPHIKEAPSLRSGRPISGAIT